MVVTTHWAVADGQYTHPLLLQISISPFSFTFHSHRAPPAVLSMHKPTAVVPSVAYAGVANARAMEPQLASTDNGEHLKMSQAK
jgi:hypothetical protein